MIEKIKKEYKYKIVKDICLLHQLFPLFYTSPNVRESKTLFDSGFHAVDSRFQVINYRFFASGSWISIIIGIPDLLRSILDYKTRDPGFRNSRFQSKNFLDSGIPIP